MSHAARAQAFYASFPQQLERVRQLYQEHASERALEALLDARHTLQRAAAYLPAHDIQSYEAAWSDVHRELSQPTRTFRFAAPHDPVASLPREAPTTAPAPTYRTHDIIHVSDNAVLAHLDACIIHTNLAGSVLLEACTRCAVIGTVGQCRLTRSSHMLVCVDTPTPVTLEQCDAILMGSRSDMEPAETCAAPAVQDFDDVFDEQHHYTLLDPEYAARLRPHLQNPSALASMLR